MNPVEDKRAKAEAAMASLTGTQRKFIHAKLMFVRAEDVARECNSNTKNPSQWADAMFRKPAVRAAFFALRDAHEDDKIMRREEVLATLSTIVRGNVGDFIEPGGGVDFEAVRDPRFRGVLDSFTVKRKTLMNGEDQPPSEIEEVELRLGNRVGAAQLLSKLQGWEAEQKISAKVEVKGLVSLRSFLNDDQVDVVDNAG